MNRPLLKGNFVRVLLWSGVAALSVGVALAQDATAAGGSRTDGQIEMDVVHALDASQPLKNDLITAATIQSEVTLAGTVSSDSSKKLAESIVSQVAGVTKVHNNLKVGDPQQAQDAMQPQPADESDPGQQQANAAPGNGQQDNGPMPPPQAYPQPTAPRGNTLSNIRIRGKTSSRGSTRRRQGNIPSSRVSTLRLPPGAAAVCALRISAAGL